MTWEGNRERHEKVLSGGKGKQKEGAGGRKGGKGASNCLLGASKNNTPAPGTTNSKAGPGWNFIAFLTYFFVYSKCYLKNISNLLDSTPNSVDLLV